MDIDIEHGVGGEWKVVTTAMEFDDTIYYVQAAVPIGVQRATIQTVALFLAAGTPLRSERSLCGVDARRTACARSRASGPPWPTSTLNG